VRGTSVSAVEVERVLADHIGVAEVAVAGVRDASGASHLEAFVVPTDPAKAGDALAASVAALAAERLAPFKVPERVTFVAELPRTPTGQLRRFVLRLGGYSTGKALTSTSARPA
jgi:4-hydroxybenzoate adenylyltransferase